MVTAGLAAFALLGACALILLALLRARTHADRRIDAILLRIDGHLEAISTGVAEAVDTAVDAGSERPFPLLTLDFDELLETLVAETASRTGADAVVLRIEGPGGRPVITSIGPGAHAETLDRSFAPPGARAYDIATIDWTYSASGDPDDAAFRSAIVTPLVTATGVPGTLAAYAYSRDAFRDAHARAVHDLLRDAAVALANARRFAELETRVHVDPATGVPNRRGYEVELGREVARASRSGRPLSVLVVGVGDRATTESTHGNGGLSEVARLVTGMTRRTDISCRRGERELAILLPGTEETGAAVLTKRIEDEARRALGASSGSVTVGLLERQPSESSDALDARIERMLGRPSGATVSALEDARNASTAVASTVRSSFASGAEHVRPHVEALRGDVLAALARELLETRGLERSLGIVVLEVDGLDDVSEDASHEAADATLGEVAGRLDRSIGTGSVHRLGASTFALVLPGSGVHGAEALVDALQSSLEPPHHAPGLVLSAGITELAEGDDAEAGLGRAEHALWQAKQAGAGTVVVAVPGRRPASFD
jgi:diguanylate cyclase (GGDEF)-like protein